MGGGGEDTRKAGPGRLEGQHQPGWPRRPERTKIIKPTTSRDTEEVTELTCLFSVEKDHL